MSGKNLRNLAEVIRDEMVMKQKILSFLEEGPKTIAEIAASLESPDNEVMYWVMGLRRYGVIEEVGKANADGFFKYEAVEGKEDGHHD